MQREGRTLSSIWKKRAAMLAVLVAATVVFTSDAFGAGIGMIMTSKSIPEATVAVPTVTLPAAIGRWRFLGCRRSRSRSRMSLNR